METSCKQQCQCTDRNIILLSTAMLTVEIASKALSDAKENLKKQHILLLEREDFYIKKYQPQYNMVMSSIPGTLNVYKHSIESREKKEVLNYFIVYK